MLTSEAVMPRPSPPGIIAHKAGLPEHGCVHGHRPCSRLGVAVEGLGSAQAQAGAASRPSQHCCSCANLHGIFGSDTAQGA